MELSRVDRLDQFITEGRLLRGAWHREIDGREHACLLVALAPECASEHERDCPVEVMPAWLAFLTPWLDDAGSSDAWPGVVRRYAALARRWHVLSAEDWVRLDYAVRATILREVRQCHTNLAVTDLVISLCERSAAGEQIPRADWVEVQEAATAAMAWPAEWASSASLKATERTAQAAVDLNSRMTDRIIDGVLDTIEAAVARGAG
jgi:hypothetical protein